MPFDKVIEVCDAVGSSVILMIEAADSVEHIDSIAAVDGVDALLIGCLDLSTDMGIPGQFDAREFRRALETVSAACQRHGKIMGLAGLYENPEIQDWAINTLKVRFMMCQQDSNILAAGAIKCAAGARSVERSTPVISRVNGMTKGTTHRAMNVAANGVTNGGMNGTMNCTKLSRITNGI